MKLHFDGLEFECSALSMPSGSGAYDDWFTCSVVVRVPSFEGSFRWDVMAGEVTAFIEALEDASKSVGAERVVRLAPAEPNVAFDFAFTRFGQIEGKYRFRGHFTGFEPTLSGSFSTDQTFVSEIVSGFRSLLQPAHHT